ncbi:MAG: hydantoinase/oxoprolinase family protein [Planctomycetaceae bacterium]
MRIIGLDIGGANLKASDGERASVSQPYPLWQRVDTLGDALGTLLSGFDTFDAVAVTMTGELADCFATKSEGVSRILAAVMTATGRPVHVWQTSGEFVAPEVAIEFPRLTAAANWHALATWAGRMTPQGAALLIDVGSTSSDVIPLNDGMPVPDGRTDLERLLSGELVYTGVRRTPICAVTDAVPVGEQMCPLAAELFATTHDVALVLGDAEPDIDCRDTADGRPATRDAALARLARMVCCDITQLAEPQLVAMAEFLRQRQLESLTAAIDRVVASLPVSPRAVLLCGEGESLARRALAARSAPRLGEPFSLSNSLGPTHSQAACAFALARLGRERLA